MAGSSASSPGDHVETGATRIPGFVNVYTYTEGEEIYLIDTGLSRAAKPVVRAFQKAHIPLDRVGKVILTHHHADHMGGAAYLLQNSHASLACHGEDADYVTGKTKAPMSFLMRLFMQVTPAPVATVLKDGDHVGPLQIIHTPGHTPGEIVIYHPTRKILFAGDALREHKGKLSLPAPRYAADVNQAVESLKRLQGLDVRLMLPGHGVPVRADFPALLDDLIRRAPAEYRKQ